MKNYRLIVGLETHVELKTKSKMFCRCNADHFAVKPNTNVCPVCLGLPGALPVPNKTAVEWTVMLAKALNCKINMQSKFDRKHYFYPDLPKGYQISQYDLPIGYDGFLDIFIDKSRKQTKKIRIRRIHLEEDTGKLLHEDSDTLVDFNRSGVPLVEIVTEADFRTSDEVKACAEKLQTTVRYLDVSTADMEKGSMRIEPNISVKKSEIELPEILNEEDFPKYKVEVKNINSFNFAKRAVDFEYDRHITILEAGDIPVQETRGFDEKTNSTKSQRVKETVADYRYFPEPDIPPINISEEQIDEICRDIPELFDEKTDRFISEYSIKPEDAEFLAKSRLFADLYEQIVDSAKKNKKITSDQLAQKVANLIINKKVNVQQEIDKIVQEIQKQLEVRSLDETSIKVAAEEVIVNNPKVVDDYKGGKESAIMFLVGQVMRATKGQADANKVKEVLQELL